jgi:RNAse (barnase) inhibitor barstar
MSHNDVLTTVLEDPGQAGIYHLPPGGRPMLKAAAERSGLACFEVGLADFGGIEAVLAKIGQDLQFPEWYGQNYDALKDCLSDFSWADAPGYLLIIAGAERLRTEQPAAFETLNEVFAAAITDFQERHLPLWVFYDLGGEGLKTLPALA